MKEGIFVDDVVEKGAAAQAGISSGDVIVAINGVKVKTVAQLQEQVSRYRPGDKIQVTVNRADKEKLLNVTLRNLSGNTEIVKQVGFSSLGAKFEPVSYEESAKLGIRSGVKVSDLQTGKLKDAGIKNGFVIIKINDTRVSSEKDIAKIYKDLTSTKVSANESAMFIVGIYPSGKTAYYAIDVNQ